MNFQKVNLKLARSPNKLPRANVKRRVIRPVRRAAVRFTWPCAVSRLQASLRRPDSKSKCKKPSLTNLAQWYLDSRSPSEGPTGLLYSVPALPISHSAESVVEALNATIAALRSKSKSNIDEDSSDKLEALLDSSLSSADPPVTPPDTAAFTGPLIDLPEVPAPSHKLPEAGPKTCGSLVDVLDVSNVPVVDSYLDFAAVADLLPATAPRPATGLVPLLPTPIERKLQPRSNQPSLAPERWQSAVGGERRHTQPQIKRKPGTRDLKSRAATLPKLGLAAPQHAPSCLQVGNTIPDPVIVRKPLAQDSLKIRVPREVNKHDLPRSLQSGEKHTGLSPGPDTEVECLMTAIDVVKDDFSLQLDPLETEIGHFSCDFSSAVSPGSSRTNLRGVQSRDDDHAGTPFSELCSVPSDLASTSQTHTKPNGVPSFSSSERYDNLHHAKTARSPSHIDEGSQHPYSDRPLPPLPLVPDPTLPSSHRTSANLAVSNATLKALLSAEDASNKSARLAGSRLSEGSAAVVRDFSDFTHQSFFPPAQQDMRSQSDGTLWPQASSKSRAAELSEQQPRARSLESLAVRKKKGRGIVFAG